MGMYCDLYAASPGELGRSLSAPETIHDFLGDEETPRIGLENAWHGLHFLQTGSAWNREGIESFLASGEPLGDVNLGDGPARYLRPEGVEELDAAFSAISDDELWSRFDRARREEESIYRGIWDEPEEDLRDEYLKYFRNLKAFVHRASRDGNALSISIA